MKLLFERLYPLSTRFKCILTILFCLLGSSAIADKLSYSFKKKPLSVALEKVSADNHVKIAFDAQLANKQMVNGAFKAATVEELLRSILASCRFEVEQIGVVYVVKPKRVEEASTVAAANLVAKSVELPRFKIWGAVVDQETGEKLPYAYIYTQDGKFATTANAEGYFNLVLPTKEPVSLCISYLGFVKKCVDVVPESRSSMMSIDLDRVQTLLGSVVVTQRQNELVQIPYIAGKSTLNPRATSDVPTINPLDFTAPLQMLPGIDATTESASDLSIRKSNPSQTQMLFDGFTLYHINHFLGQLSAFNTKAIKDIQVFKGGFDARYGGSSSSVIEITGKSGNRYNANYSVGVDMLSADVFADVPITQKLSLVVAARRSYTDMYQTSLYNDLFDKLRSDLANTSLASTAIYNEKYTPKYHFLDLHSKLTYSPDSTQSLSLTVYGGEDNMDLLYDKIRFHLNENSDIDNLGIGVKWSKQIQEKYFLRASAGYSSYANNFDHLNYQLGGKLNQVARRHSSLVNHLKDFTSKLECEYRLSPSVGVIAGGVFTNLKSGYSYENYKMTSGNVEIDTVRTVYNEGRVITGYALLDVAKGWLKNFKPGFRLTYFSPTRKVYIEPRVQLTFALAKDLSVKMAAGRYLQFLNSIPLAFLGDYTSFWAISNKNIHPVISSNHYIVGFTYNASKNLQFDVESYVKNTTGLTSQVLDPVVSNGKFKLQQKQMFYSNDVAGVDILAKYLYPKGQLSIAYSLSQSAVFPANFKFDDEFPASNDQLHEFKVFASHKVWRFNFSAAWIYGSGKPWDEMVLYNNFRPAPEYEVNSQRFACYHRLDVSTSYEQKIGSARLAITASLFNAYNRSNQIKSTYNFTSTPLQDFQSGKSPFVYSNLYGLGITPSIYINLSF
jgi:ferric enterobactin receptor